ncbi:toll/interleukin-1 receptor-like protein [Quercus lobata]|uniref:toll/interleukin-1 receptor-like protein n=1 Tax=Quercus lobata TaxID=97700 RepID=UPI001245D42E|nr:toll/interleukin-1 receptor-like protein [Quercus lobata]
MASSSLPTPPCTYDVFVNFRGEDTRANFTDHLVTTLERKTICVCIDDKDVERGKEIWIELKQAIKTSRMAVIVFSKNYANSEWCLNELVLIMDCSKSRSNQTFKLLPIFYHVSPSDVRQQKGNFAEDQLPNCTYEDMVKKWREALTDAAKLAGFHLKRDQLHQ